MVTTAASRPAPRAVPSRAPPSPTTGAARAPGCPRERGHGLDRAQPETEVARRPGRTGRHRAGLGHRDLAEAHQDHQERAHQDLGGPHLAHGGQAGDGAEAAKGGAGGAADAEVLDQVAGAEVEVSTTQDHGRVRRAKSALEHAEAGGEGGREAEHQAATTLRCPLRGVATSPASSSRPDEVDDQRLGACPTAKNANRQLSCIISPGSPNPSAMKPAPSSPGAKSDDDADRGQRPHRRHRRSPWRRKPPARSRRAAHRGAGPAAGRWTGRGTR